MLKNFRTSKGFTLVEVMIVVAIVGVLASMAVPNFVRARQTAQDAVCIQNMRTIYGAVNVALLDEGLGRRHWCDPGDDYNLWSNNPDIGLVPRYLANDATCPYGRGRCPHDGWRQYRAYPRYGRVIVVCTLHDDNLHNVNTDEDPWNQLD